MIDGSLGDVWVWVWGEEVCCDIDKSARATLFFLIKSCSFCFLPCFIICGKGGKGGESAICCVLFCFFIFVLFFVFRYVALLCVRTY